MQYDANKMDYDERMYVVGCFVGLVAFSALIFDLKKKKRNRNTYFNTLVSNYYVVIID